jgi:hypothetical protein
MQSACGLHIFTKSARGRPDSARSLHAGGPNILCMDVVAVLLGILAFAVLIALIAGIDRI